MDNSRKWAASKYREGGAVTESDPQYGAISYHNEPKDPPRYAGGGLLNAAKKIAKSTEKVTKQALEREFESAPKVSRIDMNYKDVTKRIPELTEAARLLDQGLIDASEYDRLVNALKPVEAYDFVPEPASFEDAMRALTKNKQPMYGKTSEIPAGEQTDLRLDIPAYKDHGVWVNSVHRKDAPTVYGSVSSVKNATMIGSPEKAFKVAKGETPKAPFAVIRGEWSPLEQEEAVKRAQAYLNDPEWVQVGYDPERHGYFYGRHNMQPIEAAEEVIQIGPLVLAKNPKYAEKAKQKYAGGGAIKGYASAGSVKKAADITSKVASKLMKPSEALAPKEGAWVVGTQSDRTKLGGNYKGGPGFTLLQTMEPEFKDIAWGVDSPSALSRLLNLPEALELPKGDKVYFTTKLGSETMHMGNKAVFENTLKKFKKAAEEGLLDPTLHREMNARLSMLKNRFGKNIFPEDVDILSPEFKKIANTFEKRRVASMVIGGKGVGGKKGQVFDYDKHVLDTTDPELIGAPTESLGPRLFTLSGESSYRPDLYEAFPHMAHGEVDTTAFTPIPWELALKNEYMDRFNRKLLEQGKQLRSPGSMDFTRGHEPFFQIREDLLRGLEDAGYAKGGEVDADDGYTGEPDEPLEPVYPLEEALLGRLAGKATKAIANKVDMLRRPKVTNRLYSEKIGEAEYKPGDVSKKYGARNVFDPKEIEDIKQSGYMRPRQTLGPRGKPAKDSKYFTMTDEPNQTLRVASDKIPKGRAVRREDVEIFDEATGTYKPLKKGGEVKGYAGGSLVSAGSKIKNVAKKVLESKGKYGAERVEKAADLVPNLEKQYDEHALYRAFIGDGDNAAGLMVISPKSFESYSAPLWDEYVEPQYIRELAQIARQKGFEDVPYLMLGRKESEYLPRELQELYIAGHEGRHRTRALDKLGDESTLIRMIPRSSMREHLPRRSQEEYIDALNKELGLYPLVRPEQDTEEVRSLVRLPKVFAKGGSANLEDEFRKADMIDMTGFRRDPMAEATYQVANRENPYLGVGRRLKKIASLPIEIGKELGKDVVEEGKHIFTAPHGMRDLGVNLAANTLGQFDDSPVLRMLANPSDPTGVFSKYDPATRIYRAMKGNKPLYESMMGSTKELPFITTAASFAIPGAATKKGSTFIKNLVKKFEGAPVGLSIEDVTPKSVNFVSSVERAIKGHKMESMNGEQWANWMRANASKSAKKEAEATGLYEWLKSQGKVSKADIEAYVEGNLPQITKLEKGAALKLTPKDEIRLSELDRRNTFKDQEPLTYEEYNELMRLENIKDKKSPEDLMKKSKAFEHMARQAQARGDKEQAQSLFRRSEHFSNRAEALELNPLEVGGSKFEQWKEPGGEKYREVTLSIPRRHTPEYVYDVHGYSPKSGFKTREEAQAYVDEQNELIKELREKAKTVDPSVRDAMNRAIDNMENFPHQVIESELPISRSPDYRVPSAHAYGDPEADINRLLHYRANERLTPEGKKVSFLEELQSDWAQKGRDLGFKSNQEPRRATTAVKQEAGHWEVRDQNGDFITNIVEPDISHDSALSIANRRLELNNPTNFSEESQIPRGPYVTDTGDWTKLGLKHALKDAIEQGHDYLVWTTGEQQAKRWDLSKNVSEIAYHPKGRALEVFDKEGNNIINEEGINPEDLADYIGKEYAEKVLNSPEIDRGYNILKGDNLTIGGEGMKAYYDRIIPQSMNDILKQYGIKDGVKPIDVTYIQTEGIPKNLSADALLSQYGRNLAPDQRQFLERYVDRLEYADEMVGAEDLVDEYKNWLDLQDFSPKPIKTGTHLGIEITPELIEKIYNEGLPHFNSGGEVDNDSAPRVSFIKKLVDEFSS